MHDLVAVGFGDEPFVGELADGVRQLAGILVSISSSLGVLQHIFRIIVEDRMLLRGWN
jgi:hypothetical protein